MLLRIKTLFSKKNIKKLLRSSLCFLLCIMTVICFGGVLAPAQAHAFALVDDAIYFIVAFLICCGLTFSTTSAATAAAQQFYAQAPPSVQEIIDYQAEQLQKDSALPFGVLAVLKSQWKALIDEFMAQFPQFCNIDVDYTNLLNQQLTDGMSFYQTLISDSSKVIYFDVPWYDDSYVTTQLSNSSTLTFCTSYNISRVIGSTAYSYLSSRDYFNSSDGTHYAVFSVPNLNLTGYFTLGPRQFNTPSLFQRFYKSVDCPGYLTWNGHLVDLPLFNFFIKAKFVL